MPETADQRAGQPPGRPPPLARKIFHGRAGQLYQRYQDGMEDQIGALGLVLNALVLFNTRYMDAAVTQLREDGFDIRDEDVARLSRSYATTSTCSATTPSSSPTCPAVCVPFATRTRSTRSDRPWPARPDRMTSGGAASALPGCPRAAGGRAGTARRPAESDDVAKAAVARVLADRSYSAQYGRQQVGPQCRQIGQIEGVMDVTTLPPGREQARAAQDSEVAGNFRG